MATMVPASIQYRGSEAEVKLYAALASALPNEWTVLHHSNGCRSDPEGILRTVRLISC